MKRLFCVKNVKTGKIIEHPVIGNYFDNKQAAKEYRNMCTPVGEAFGVSYKVTKGPDHWEFKGAKHAR